jgi:hypothetical protein
MRPDSITIKGVIHMGILTLQILGTAALLVSHLVAVVRDHLVAGR